LDGQWSRSFLFVDDFVLIISGGVKKESLF